MEFSRSRIPDPCPSRAQADRDARVMRETIAFFQQHGARVVNMSWSRPESGFLRELESCASQLPVAERQAIARYHVETIRAAVKASLRAAPEILFVRAAGNSGASVAFENCGACARVPNQIVVGAVDRGGDETSITNVGEDVVVHANGQNIEVLEPGGGRTLASGTSFAAPAVVNTVAKLLAVRPTLTTTEIVRVLACTADRSVDGRVRLLNERRALELVERSASPSLSCQPQ
jgi:subtilisin family serine protease